MASRTSGMDEILRRWRDEIKLKQRRIISFEETVAIKIQSIKALIHPDTEPLDGWECREFIYTRKRERRFTSDWRPIAVGQTWGQPDGSALFRCAAAMPKRCAGRKVALKIYFGGDGLLSIGGRPYHGLDPFRDTVLLAPSARGDETYDFAAEAYIFWHFGEPEMKTFECSHFAVVDQEMSDAYWDFRAVYNVFTVPDQDPNLAAFLKAGLEKAVWLMDQNDGDLERRRRRVREARAILRREIYDSDRFKQAGRLHLCGNSHLDIVFLWTHAEFVRKIGRTHATALRLLEQYPEFIFSQSQPLMYQEMKDHYPTMYAEVRERVKAGRWEVIGAMWVEPDCNLISGESFVRQILHGVRFIRREFGVTPRTCWCPDVFGNAWTMPQILAKCGLRYFVTHKMVVWNDTNPWTKHTFWWQGPDGSRVLSLVPPTHFIGTVEPDHMAKHWDAFSDRSSIGESLYNYGWGDGGGGPDAEMLEYVKRYGDFPGVTPARPNTIEGALDSMAARAAAADLPVVNDELYLEEHRGVHTTKARLKKLNRRCEFLYRKAELWSALAPLPYPREALEKGWKIVLTNQFHDSLPGSHITPVYHDLLDAYKEALAIGNDATARAQAAIAAAADTCGTGQAAVVFNSQPFERASAAMVAWPEGDVHVLDSDGAEVAHQFVTDFETGRRGLAFAAVAPAGGYAVYRIVPGQGGRVFPPVAATAETLENEILAVSLNANGEVVSLVEKASGRQMVDPAKRANVLTVFEDVPGKYEAWDLAPTYAKTAFPLADATLRVAEQGPLRAVVEVRRAFEKSTLVQRIVLRRGARRLDFVTWVDWKQQQRLLKVRFHTPFVTRTAAYDIPYGVIERSACRNNSFEEARFEVPAHLWMDLSQPDAGLSLLNDCKYGHEAYDGMLGLSLLRGPLNPDPQSDQEEHTFTYALYPHEGTWREANTMREALDLNDPLDTVLVAPRAGARPKRHSFVAVGAESVTLEALKKAEDSDDTIVRLVERQGKTAPVDVSFDRPVRKASEVNLLEEQPQPASVANGAVRCVMRPFEIRTFAVAF